MHRIPTAITLTALAVGAATTSAREHAAHAANTAQDKVHLRRDRAAIRLINKAVNHVRHEHRGCRAAFAPSSPTLTDAKPSDALLGAIGVLRRPATERDRLDSRPLFFPARGIYSDWIRVATAADGREFFVIAAQDRLRAPAVPARCIALQNAELDRLLENRSPELRRVTLRLKGRLDREEHPPGGFEPTESLFLLDRTPDGGLGGGGGGVSLRFFLQRGLFSSSGTGKRSAVAGLLPDGVASIDVTFPRRVSRGPHADPKIYPRAIHLTVAVQDNVVSFDVDRPPPDVVRAGMTWRAADGSVVRVIKAG